MQFQPPPNRQRPTASDYAQQWSQGLQQLGSTFTQTAQARQQQARQAMLDKYLAAKEERDQQDFDYNYGKLIDPNATVGMPTGQMGQSSFMPGGQQPVATGLPLIEAHKQWLAGGMKQDQMRPEFYSAMGKEERSIFNKRQDPQYQAETDLKIAQAEKARREASMPPGSDESYTIGGQDANGNIIQVGSKSGKIRVLPVPGGQPLYPTHATDAQANAAGYGDRAVSAHATIDQLFNGQVDPNSLGFAAQESRFTPNFAKSGNIQSLDQAKRNFLNAILRRESGAVISPSEFEEGAKQYFPQYGDTPETVRQKSLNRQQQIQNLKRAAGPMSMGGGAPQSDGLMWQGRPLKDTPANRAWLQQQGGGR